MGSATTAKSKVLCDIRTQPVHDSSVMPNHLLKSLHPPSTACCHAQYSGRSLLITTCPLSPKSQVVQVIRETFLDLLFARGSLLQVNSHVNPLLLDRTLPSFTWYGGRGSSRNNVRTSRYLISGNHWAATVPQGPCRFSKYKVRTPVTNSRRTSCLIGSYLMRLQD
jgi:hypothetical protein